MTKQELDFYEDTLVVPQEVYINLVKDLQEATDRVDELEDELFRLKDGEWERKATSDDVAVVVNEARNTISDLLKDTLGITLNDLERLTADEAKKLKSSPRRAAERDVILSALMPPAVKNQFTGNLAVAVLVDDRIAVFDPDVKEPGLTVLANDQSKADSYMARAVAVLRRMDSLILTGRSRHEQGCHKLTDPSDNCICVLRDAEVLVDETETILGGSGA